jgi:hypothetical protein
MFNCKPKISLLAALHAAVFCFAVIGSAAPQQISVPTVGFSFSFPGSQPDKYEFTIPRTGSALYSSDGKLSADAETNDFRIEFPISESTRSRIFQLAEKVHYFQGQVDSKKKGIAQTGVKVLIYTDGNTRNSTTYNFSTMAPVQELTTIFQNMATTLEFGQRLEYYHRYQKLALDEELKRIEQMLDQKSLTELQAIAPVLKSIAEDQTVINPVRSRAQRLLARAKPS